MMKKFIKEHFILVIMLFLGWINIKIIEYFLQ